jgi:hypothetical protein
VALSYPPLLSLAQQNRDGLKQKKPTAEINLLMVFYAFLLCGPAV